MPNKQGTKAQIKTWTTFYKIADALGVVAMALLMVDLFFWHSKLISQALVWYSVIYFYLRLIYKHDHPKDKKVPTPHPVWRFAYSILIFFTISIGYGVITAGRCTVRQCVPPPIGNCVTPSYCHFDIIIALLVALLFYFLYPYLWKHKN